MRSFSKEGGLARIAGQIRTGKTLGFLFEQARKEAGKQNLAAEGPVHFGDKPACRTCFVEHYKQVVVFFAEYADRL